MIWYDVDAALAAVPINVSALIDDGDFKTREESVAYNAAGLDLVWNFLTTAGAFTQTAVTPTDTGGNYDWINKGNGHYSIEIPASGGASINNDTEGFGWFTGFCTGVLPWTGPICGFRAAALNNSLIDAGTTGLLAPTVAARTLDVSVGGEAGVDWANVGSPTTTLDLSGTTIKTATDVETKVNRSVYIGGAVWYDTGGAAGTTSYVHGTPTNPNSSMANSRTIADALNLNIFEVSQGSSITLDQGYVGYVFRGERWTLALASRAITTSHFAGAIVSGLSTGTGAEFDDCSIGTVTIANDMLAIQCGLNGTFTCQAAGQFNFIDCFNDTAAGTDWILDFGALGATTIGIRNYVGGCEVRNMAAGDVLTFIGSGRLTLAASCTAGTVNIAGTVNLINNGSGQTIADTSRFNEDQNIGINWANVSNPTTTLDLSGTTIKTVTDIETILGTPSDLGGGATVSDNLADIAAFIDTEIATLIGYVDTEVAAILALLDNARGEPGQGAPPVNPDMATKVDYLYKAWRNRSTQTATEYALYADNATTKDHEAACSDDDVTFDRGEVGTGA